MRRILALVVVTIGGAACGAARAATGQGVSTGAATSSVAGPSYAFTNGQWFTGNGFRLGTRYAVNGVFVERRPARVDSTIDLRGGFAIPPFGDAHTHNLDAPSTVDALREAYVREGTFYVQVLTNTRTGAEAARPQFNRPCALDVTYANGGLTSTLSHPFIAYEPFAMGLYNPRQWAAHATQIRQSRLRENDAYWFIDTRADLDAKWAHILAGHPDLIKIFLLDASESAPVPADTGLPSGHGLKPSLAAEIVRRAHAVGLRVAAHVETAKDFEIAAQAGVDIFAHLPGYAMSREERADLREIGESAARLAGDRVVVVTPTVRISLFGHGPDSAADIARRRDLQRRNITLLEQHGVRVVVGSDWYGQTAWPEIEAMRALDLWDNLALLKLWSEATPQTIFPTRRVGRLEPGYEASFLVISEDPIQRLEAVRDIRLRVKQGCLVSLPPA